MSTILTVLLVKVTEKKQSPSNPKTLYLNVFKFLNLYRLRKPFTGESKLFSSKVIQLLGILEVSNLVKISFFDADQNGELVEGLNKSNRTFFV